MPWEASRIQAENLSKSMSPKKKRLVDDIYHPRHSERLVCLGTIFVSEISIHAFHFTKILPRILVETSGPQFWCKTLSHPPLSTARSGGREVGSTPKVTDFGKTNYCHIKGQSDYDYEPLISSFWIFSSSINLFYYWLYPTHTNWIKLDS